MIKPLTNSQLNKSKTSTVFEYLLLAVCLCVIFIRPAFTESPNPQSAAGQVNIATHAYSLMISAVLIFTFLAWLLHNFWRSKFLFRFTAIEIGLSLFILAAIISSFVAPNKRAAITDSVTLIAPALIAILLAQLLKSPPRVTALLYVIVALGAVAAVYCTSQFLWINDIMINDYETDPNAFLAKIGIQPASFQQMLLEHSLYSRDVRGFFTTGNSAGSFALLASFVAIGLLLERIRNFKSNLRNTLALVFFSAVTCLVVYGLFITKSKGAIAASLVTAAMFTSYLLFGTWIKAHRKSILIACLLLMAGCICVVTHYGLTHDRLPGGNSTLVRWQYWHASAQMYADHWLTGVGPGNFATFYTHYKSPAALESVADPHNFLLTILTQYGPLGLIGFLAAVFAPLARLFFQAPPPTQDKQTKKSQPILTAALACGLLGFLLHNCIDFAIFEPGVLTAFWAMIACLIALTPKAKRITLTPPVFVKVFATVLIAVIVGAYFKFSLVPVATATAKTKQALRDVRFTHQLLDQAAQADPLDPAALSLNARFYLQDYHNADKQILPLLDQAAQRFIAAINRNPADYKNYEKLAEIYTMLAKNSPSQTKTDRLKKAFDYALLAIDRYPGSARLHLQAAQLAEQLGKTDSAIQHYKKTIEIEDAYRKQFQIMYPGTEIYSRLGHEKYDFAASRLKQLTPK